MIRVEGVTKVFGDDPESVLSLLQEGHSKDDIRARIGHTVGVNDVSFALEPGEFFVIMGLSGSGKSTLLRCINRLIEPTAGKVFLQTDEGDIDITAADEKELRQIRKHRMSMVFQRFGLFPHRSVLDNVAYGLEIQGRSKDERDRIAQETLEMVGLGTWGESRPDELSGGMQQRVGLARALATQANVLLMDEPFSALDPLIKVEMQNEMIGIQNKLHRTILFITHDLDEALKLGDRIAIMEGGEVVQLGTPEEIIVNPKTEYVADFVEHADPTSVITARTVALPLTHSRFSEVKTEDGVRYFADRGLHDVVIGVDRENRFVSLTVNDKLAELKPLADILEDEEESPNLRKSGLALSCREDATLRHILRGRLHSRLPTLVISENGVLHGVITERALIQGILDKRGYQESGAETETNTSANDKKVVVR